MVTLPDTAAHILGGWDSDDPHQQWQTLTQVWFLDPSTVVFGDTGNRVVALSVDGVGKWTFEGDEVRYNLRGSVIIGAEGGQVLVYGTPGFLVLDTEGEVVWETRVERPVLRGRERIVAATEAVSADFVVFSEVHWKPPLRQTLHIVNTRAGESSSVNDLPTAVWDDGRGQPAGGRNRRMSVRARHGLIVYSARGDSVVTIRDPPGGGWVNLFGGASVYSDDGSTVAASNKTVSYYCELVPE